jgi:beta-glucosidase
MAIIQFPQDFKWGAATASYQIEGGFNEGGRGTSIWDTFSKTPGKVKNGDNGDIACDSYHRYEEDIELMKNLGISVYRFSVAWPRIIPDGDGQVNAEGLAFYHKFVDKLLEAGIEPYCTLYHWDLPQALQDKGGWDNRNTIDAFVRYSEVMFKEFNGKIKQWITLNEPWCVSFLSNYLGVHAPGNKDLQLAVNISHNLLVAHGQTVKKFRELGIEGQIGFAPNVTWLDPYSSTNKDDIGAADRERAWFVEWFFDPVFKGEYPQFMVDWFEKKGAVLNIQPGDMETINQPIDFLGINYYTGHVVRYKENNSHFDSEMVELDYLRTDIGWPIYPEGFNNVLQFITNRYGAIPIYITENGACYNNEVENGRVHDALRIEYIRKHIIQVNRAIASGVNMKGYFTWSLMDNFEWAEGYTMRFGMIHLDYDTLVRTPKDSYYWYKKVIGNNWLEV